MNHTVTKRIKNASFDLGGLDTKIGYLLRRAQSASQQEFISIFTEQKIAPGQYSVLKIISLNPGISQKELSTALNLDQSTLVPILNHLQKHKWIYRKRSKMDARIFALYATASGEKKLTILNKLIDQHEKAITNGLKRSEKKALVSLLYRIAHI